MEMKTDTPLDPKWGEYSQMHDPRALANFKPRKTDVLITTAPKAGTTWMQQILHQLRSGGDERFDSIDNVVPWLERPREGKSWQEVLNEYESINNPRIFKTHCTYEQTPGVDDVRIILSSRDPRDCCVSYYHHMRDMTDEALDRVCLDKPASFDEFFEVWMHYASWYRNVSSWWPHIHKQNILWLRFEDMKSCLELTIDRILDFLNWKLSDEEKQRALNNSNFDWMKQNSEKFTRFSDTPKPMFKEGGFIRKGKVGDYKNLLSAEQEQRILDRAKIELPADCIDFLALNS